MPDLKSTPQHQLRTVAWLLPLLALSFLAAYFCLFGSFSEWDDEGYIMLSIDQYVRGHHVPYEEVYSQYGPSFFLFNRVIHGFLGVPITSDSVRWVALVFWLFLTGVCFLIVLRLTRRPALAFLAGIPFSLALSPLAIEPAHPQGIVLVLVGLVLLLPSLLSLQGPYRSWLFGGIGVCLAALFLVKANIGTFLLLSVVWTMLSLTRTTRWTTAARYALAAACFALPALLMREHLAERLTQKYALLTMVTLSPILFLLVRSPGPVVVQRKDWIRLASALAGTAAAILLAMWLGGTSPAALVSAVILEPAKLASTFFLAAPLADVTLGRLLFAVLVFVIYLAVEHYGIALHLRRQGSRMGKERDTVIPFTAIALGCFGATAIYYFYDLSLPDVWVRASSFIWVGLLGGSGGVREAADRYFLRLLLVLTAAFQVLHAYPVAGSQQTWSLLWIAPLAVVCLHDAWRHVSPFSLFKVSKRLQYAAAGAVLVAAAGSGVLRTRSWAQQYSALPALRLPGAARVRSERAPIYQWIVKNLQAHSDTFISLPGLNSLYFWTGKEPPTSFNAGFWMALLDDEKQQAVIEELNKHPRASVIRNASVVDFWGHGQKFHERPLVAYIEQNFYTVATYDGFEFMVRKGRTDVAIPGK